MFSNGQSQVDTAARAQIRAVSKEVDAKLLVPKALVTRGALGDSVRRAVREEEGALVGGQRLRAPAVQMRQTTARRHDGVTERDRVRTCQALDLPHWSLPATADLPKPDAIVAGRLPASTRRLQWEAVGIIALYRG